MAETSPAPVAQLSPDAEPGEASSEVSPENDFDSRVARLMQMIEDDPRNRDRMIAELYVTVSEFGDEFRNMMEQMNNLGPAGFMKAILGRRKGD